MLFIANNMTLFFQKHDAKCMDQGGDKKGENVIISFSLKNIYAKVLKSLK